MCFPSLLLPEMNSYARLLLIGLLGALGTCCSLKATPSTDKVAVSASSKDAEVAAKLKGIVIPGGRFQSLELGRALSMLSAISEDYDESSSASKGVQIALKQADAAGPA